MNKNVFDLQLFADGDEPAGDGATPPANEPSDTGKQDDGGILSGDNKEGTDGGNSSGGILSGEGNKPPEGDNPGNKDGEGDNKDDTPEGAPEKYEDFKIPEGLEVNPESLTGFQAVAKDLNLTQEGAQKLVDFQAQMMQSQLKEYDEMSNKQANDWKAETNKAYSKEEISDAVRAFKSAPPEFQKLLVDYRLENNKAVVGYFSSLGKQMHEDGFEPGGGNESKTPKSAAEVLYPDLVKK